MQEKVSALTAELEVVKKQNQDLIKQKEGQGELLRRLQDEAEQHVAQLARTTRDSYGTAGRTPADVEMLDPPLGSAIPEADGMTIQEIKEWLIDHGFEGEVWELASRRTPRVKKADWVSLMKSKQ